MTPDRRSPFAYIGPYMASFTVLGIALPALLYAIIMVMLGWRNPAIGAGLGGGMFDPRDVVVTLYDSPASAQYFSKVGGNYENLLAPWRQYLKERSRNHQVLNSPAELDKLKSGILVLASAVSLGNAELEAIAAFRARGGSVLATWATGTRNERGDWIGWRFLEQLGASEISEAPRDSDARQLVLNGESTLNTSQGAGQRIWMNKTAEALLRMKGPHIAGRFMNWARIPDEQRQGEGAIIYAEDTRSASRSVVFAFPESAWETRPGLTHLLIDDVLNWLAHDVTVVKAAWPMGKRAAQVIQMDTEDGFPNARNFADQMRAHGLPSTFFLLTSVAKQHPDTVNALASEFELGLHGDIHVGFKGQDTAVQKQRLSNMKYELGSIYKDTRAIAGFRAPTESYDANTENLLHEAGYRYHAADPARSEARLPLFAKISGAAPSDDLLVLPRTQRDDINLAQHFPNPEMLTRALIDDFNHASQTGALGWLSVHSQNFGQDSPLNRAFPDYLTHVVKSKDRVWFASARQINDWWRDRERVRVFSKFDGKRLDLDVTITGDAPVKGPSVVAMLPIMGVAPTIRAVKVGTVLPTVIGIDAFRVAIVFEQLRPGNYNYQVTFTDK